MIIPCLCIINNTKTFELTNYRSKLACVTLSVYMQKVVVADNSEYIIMLSWMIIPSRREHSLMIIHRIRRIIEKTIIYEIITKYRC